MQEYTIYSLYSIKPIIPMECHHNDRNVCACVRACVRVCVCVPTYSFLFFGTILFSHGTMSLPSSHLLIQPNTLGKYFYKHYGFYVSYTSW